MIEKVEDDDYLKLVMRCNNAEGMSKAMNDVMKQIPKIHWRPFCAVKIKVLQEYGAKGLYAKFNNSMVADVLNEYFNETDSRTIETGERDGVKYELYKNETEKPT